MTNLSIGRVFPNNIPYCDDEMARDTCLGQDMSPISGETSRRVQRRPDTDFPLPFHKRSCSHIALCLVLRCGWKQGRHVGSERKRTAKVLLSSLFEVYHHLAWKHLLARLRPIWQLNNQHAHVGSGRLPSRNRPACLNVVNDWPPVLYADPPEVPRNVRI